MRSVTIGLSSLPNRRSRPFVSCGRLAACARTADGHLRYNQEKKEYKLIYRRAAARQKRREENRWEWNNHNVRKKNRHETNRFIYRKHRRVSVWIKTSRRTYSAPQLKVRIIFIPAAFIVDNSIRFLSLLWENVLFGELQQEEERKRKGLMIAGCAEVVTKPRGQQLTKMYNITVGNQEGTKKDALIV